MQLREPPFEGGSVDFILHGEVLRCAGCNIPFHEFHLLILVQSPYYEVEEESTKDREAADNAQLLELCCLLFLRHHTGVLDKQGVRLRSACANCGRVLPELLCAEREVVCNLADRLFHFLCDKKVVRLTLFVSRRVHAQVA